MNLPSITDRVKGFVETAIFSGDFAPGARIKEEQVAARLEVSRPPVREALKLLEAEGLVIRKPRCGVFVAEITAGAAWEIYTLKSELYAFSLRLAFPRLDSSDIARMGRLADAMDECVAAHPPSIVSYQELNTSFHDIHIEAAAHSRLKEMIQRLHNQVRYFSMRTLADPAHLQKSCDYHRRIFQALQSGDRESAIRLTRDHVLVALERFGSAADANLKMGYDTR
jgi:DNA-binding GntR family transcriptional regulator